jgi:hypothetical protein
MFFREESVNKRALTVRHRTSSFSASAGYLTPQMNAVAVFRWKMIESLAVNIVNRTSNIDFET